MSEATDFLQKFRPSGPWLLVAILPDPSTAGDAKTAVARCTSDIEEADAWIEGMNRERNIYFTVNPTLYSLNKKPSREDISSMDWLHVDIDPRVGEDLKEERDRILGMLESPPGKVPPPTCIIFSGGGYQAFWRLEKPLNIEGKLDLAEKAAAYNIQMEVEFRADSCHNVDRVMRVPGTTNWPSMRKKKAGRVPTPASLVFFNEELVYPIERFTAAPTVQGADNGFSAPDVDISGNVPRIQDINELGAHVSDKTKEIIVQGIDLDDPTKFQGRSEWLFRVCCDLVRAEIPDEVIYSIVTDPGFKISESVRDKGSQMERYALRQIGRAHEHAIDPHLAELNMKHAVIGDVGGKCRIISEVQDRPQGRPRVSYQSFGDFKNRYCNRTVSFDNGDGKVRSVPVGQWWINHPKRRDYETVVFSPSGDVPGAYNLWKGFAYGISSTGSCDLFLKHVRENVCAGVEKYYDYLMGWMAMAVQHPDQPGMTAVVIRGRQGTGKSFFAKTFGALFGRHFLQVSNSKHLVGHFNAHLRDCVVLFGDEAFYAGDKGHESVLKMLVTEEQITIEAKGVDADSYPNYVHLIMASNDDWVVPANINDRRFFVLDIVDDVMQNSKYFKDIWEQLESGGFEALLYTLMHYDLSKYDVRKMPKTKALRDQKLFSMSPEEEWWHQKLEKGEIIDGLIWPEYVVCSTLVHDFSRYQRTWTNGRRSNQTRLGRFLRKAFPGGIVQKQRLNDTLMVVSESGDEVEVERPNVYMLPSLSECREHWDKDFGGPFEWEESPALINSPFEYEAAKSKSLPETPFS